jgi:GAF domain-containing protein
MDGARVRDLEQRLAEALERLEASDRERVQGHEQQTATAEILRVISQSPTDLTPVAQAIAENAARLCETTYTAVFRFDGALIHWVAAKGATSEQEEALRSLWPRPATRERLVGRTILSGTTLHIADVAADPTFTTLPATRADLGIRTVLNVPMLRDGRPVGVVGLIRSEVKPFSAREISLVQTFADEAVIAIENVRLFTELQTSNRELTTALDRQSATSDILRVISRSQTDVQPVFETIVQSAVRLLGGYSGTVTRVVGDQIEIAAMTSIDAVGDAAQRARYPQSLGSGGSHATAIRNRTPFNITDAQTDAGLPEPVRAFARVRGIRGLVVVPLLRQHEGLGAISVTRHVPGGFTR